jgi:hypothetical protein
MSLGAILSQKTMRLIRMMRGGMAEATTVAEFGAETIRVIVG